MKPLLTALLWCLLATQTSYAQLKVAQYSFGEYGTVAYEHFAFCTNNGERSKIYYSYGKTPHEIELHFSGRDTMNGKPFFKVRFSNGHELYVIPKGLQVRITDLTGRYDKTLSWEYEGPIDGRGTHCDVCAADDSDAMEVLQSAYLK